LPCAACSLVLVLCSRSRYCLDNLVKLWRLSSDRLLWFQFKDRAIGKGG
jgi:hypothetical protein